RTGLETRIERLLSPPTGEEEQRRAVLDRRIAADRLESDRKLGYCLAMIPTAREVVATDRRELPAKEQPELQHQEAKLALLAELAEQGHETSLRLLLEDAAAVDDYDLDGWAADTGLRSAASLRSFARAFQLDAADICNVSHHSGSMSPEFAEFALQLRLFRQANPWLASNPSNDIDLDFFNRNVVANGARHLGGWSDKGDIIHANTLYYGWRSSPDGARQILVIANMEGRLLRRYSLRFLLPVDAVWHRKIVSPGMADHAPDIIDRSTVLKQFRGGEVLLYERYL
ncbi:MAG: glucosylglycerol hydrolase, partial [Spirochaetia bacterium]